MSKKEKFAFYISPEKKAILERRYQEDGSRSLTAFIENAVDFYLDYLSANNAGLFLPASLQSYLDSRLGQMEDRLGALLFKQAAEQDNPYAQYLLGKLYLTGEGVPRDRELARQWFHLAESGGHTYAAFVQAQMDRSVPQAVLLSATLLLQSLGAIFESRAPQEPVPGGLRIDRKRLQKLRELREARGLRGTGYDEGPYLGGMTMGW